VRRGQALTFSSSDELRACPHLQGRACGSLSATCVPLLFNGRGIGVLHATGPDGEAPTSVAAAGLRSIANDSAMRIGTMRVMATTQFQAKTDGLTGMVNRRTLEERLRELVNAHTSMTLAMVDLDHFKILNDTYGHEGGDRALRVFSTVIHDTLRGGDIAGRYGGEEFVLAFPGLTMADALLVLERVREALGDATESGACPPFTASFGVAEWRPDMSVDAILHLADDRLREAKRLGRDRVVSVEPSTAAAG
jgi:diguanylate cyclase (GGDEF)-like protein